MYGREGGERRDPGDREAAETGGAGEVTRLLAAWRAGETEATERLFAVVYAELGRLAARQLRGERPAHTLQTTDLVHEAYLRLAGQERADWKNRGQFFAVAAMAMRRILVDHARRRRAAKRGEGIEPSPLDAVVVGVESSIDLVELDRALDKLEVIEPREARIVELRFFAGLSVPDVARSLGLSESTVERDWAMARAWLRRELGDGPSPSADPRAGETG